MTKEETEQLFIKAEEGLKTTGTLAICPEDLTREQLAAAQGGQNGTLQKEEKKDRRH